MKREIIVLYFRSHFLSVFEISYSCPGQNCLSITSKLEYPNDTNQVEMGGPIAYFPGWEPNKNITSDCLFSSRVMFTYRVIQSDTINNMIYKNVIYSKYFSIDSSSTNQHFYSREIYFAKNVGIIKYSEISRYYNIQRTFSLKSYKVIQ